MGREPPDSWATTTAPRPASAPGWVPGLGGVGREEARARDSESISASLTSQHLVSWKLNQGPRQTPPGGRSEGHRPSSHHNAPSDLYSRDPTSWLPGGKQGPGRHLLMLAVVFLAIGSLDDRSWQPSPADPCSAQPPAASTSWGAHAQQTPAAPSPQQPAHPREPAPGVRPATRPPMRRPWGAGAKQTFLPHPGTLPAPQQLSLLSWIRGAWPGETS